MPSKNAEKSEQTLQERQDGAKDAKPYLEMLQKSKDVFKDWNLACDNSKRAYADLKRLRKATKGDAEFQIYWANMEVVKPSIYSRAPVPVVTPAFKSRQPLIRTAAEVVERACIANQKKANGHRHMLLVRDDVALFARGVVWAEYDVEKRGGKSYKCAPYEHVLRENFLHDPQANWTLVEWVARGSWFSRDQIGKRFKSVDMNKLTFKGDDTDTPKAYNFESKVKVWEIWHKGDNEVTWVAEDCEDILEQSEPPLDLEGFFPCPEPAYATLEPESLIPVPDWLFYADQVDEINALTKKISALTDDLRLQGFYEAGAETVTEAVTRALEGRDARQLVPITGLGGLNAGKDLVQWLPLGEVAATIRELVEQRKELITNVYEITGISDIMRGSTQASETLGAQQLKSQYGSVRIRNRQEEMVRIGRDVTAICAEIISENFDAETLARMTRIELPTEAELEERVAQQAKQIGNQALAQKAQLRAQPQQGPPGQPQQPQQPPQPQPQQPDPIAMAQQQVQALMAEASKEVTWEKVVALLNDERMAPFALDIETDSTIQADEQAEKQMRTEFTTAVGAFLMQASELVGTAPETGPLVGELLQFATAPYRAGRQMESTIDELVEQLNAKAKQASQQKGGPSPDEIKAQAEAKKMADEGEARKIEAAEKAKVEDAKRQKDQFETQQKAQQDAVRFQAEQAAMADKHKREMEALQVKTQADLARVEQQAALDREKHTREMEKLTVQLETARVSANAQHERQEANGRNRTDAN